MSEEPKNKIQSGDEVFANNGEYYLRATVFGVAANGLLHLDLGNGRRVSLPNDENIVPLISSARIAALEAENAAKGKVVDQLRAALDRTVEELSGCHSTFCEESPCRICDESIQNARTVLAKTAPGEAPP